MAPEVEDPEEGWNQDNSNGGGAEKSGSKENDEPMETDDSSASAPNCATIGANTQSSTAARRKISVYDIQLDAPPKDGKIIQ